MFTLTKRLTTATNCKWKCQFITPLQENDRSLNNVRSILIQILPPPLLGLIESEGLHLSRPLIVLLWRVAFDERLQTICFTLTKLCLWWSTMHVRIHYFLNLDMHIKTIFYFVWGLLKCGENDFSAVCVRVQLWRKWHCLEWMLSLTIQLIP